MGKFKESFSGFNKELEKAPLDISGMLGLPIGGHRVVNVPGRNGFVYVRLRNTENEVIQAFNNQVSPAYDLPVKVVREGNRYIIKGVDTEKYQSNWSSASSFLPSHHTQHEFDVENGGGGDIVWTYSRQFMPMLSIPSGSFGAPNVVISPYTLRNLDGIWKYVGGTGTANLTQYNPTGSYGVMVLVYIDASTGNPNIIVNSGSYFPATYTGTASLVPYFPTLPSNPNFMPDAAIRLVSGTLVIGWDNIYDARQFLAPIPTGSTGGGLSSIAVQDEGVAKGNATTFNFVGGRLLATVAGSVATITASPDPQELIGIMLWNDGIPFGTGTIIDVAPGGNVSISLSGSVLSLRDSSIAYVRTYNTGSFVGDAVSLDFQYPLAAGFTGSTAYPYLQGTLLAWEDVSSQMTGSNAHFALTGTIALGTDRLFFNGIRQQRSTHYTVDSNGRGFQTLFTGSYSNGEVLIMEYGNAGMGQPPYPLGVYDEGIYQGQVAGINFTGDGVNASVDVNHIAQVQITGSTSGSGGDFVKLMDSLLTSDTGSFVFAGIPQGYTHLMIKASFRGASGSATQPDMQVFINEDTSTANYSMLQFRFYPSGTANVGMAGDFNQNGASNIIGIIPARLASASMFSSETWDILDYTNTGKRKAVRRQASLFGAGTAFGDSQMQDITVWWENTSAVSIIRISANGITSSYKFLAQSRATLYGLK